MIINICLQGISRKPVGGYKVIYEYANRLIDSGHEVNIVYNSSPNFKKLPIPKYLKHIMCKFMVKTEPKWFELSKQINKICVPRFSDSYVPKGDIIFATAVETAESVLSLADDKGIKCYFIQDFENWNYSDAEVIQTYKFGFNNFVVSSWLKKIVDEHSETESVLVSNGINLKDFYVDKNIQRHPRKIAMLYHLSERKGSIYGLEVLQELKKEFPEITVEMFGSREIDISIPEWINYTSKATPKQIREIFNECSIYIYPSLKDGFGLTGLEAMACGCAYITTNYLGVFEYGVDGWNCLMSEPKNTIGMKNNVAKVFKDSEIQSLLTNNGLVTAKERSTEVSFSTFLKSIERIRGKK